MNVEATEKRKRGRPYFKERNRLAQNIGNSDKVLCR